MKLLQKIILLLALLIPSLAQAQFYVTGDDPGKLKWRFIETDNFKVIYPAGCDSLARKYAFELEKYKVGCSVKNNSYVQPFGSGPLYYEPIARNNYINMISSAKRYVYITTPYLLLDTTTVDALTIAAKSGVDVKIIMPGIPDKRFVWYLGRAYYKELINAGVKVYEFIPGFIHSKMMVVDDVTACVGTINFDFRSLYLHFENAIIVYNDKEVLNVKDDIVNIIEQSKEITKEDIKRRKWYEKFIANILRFFVPLM